MVVVGHHQVEEGRHLRSQDFGGHAHPPQDVGVDDARGPGHDEPGRAQWLRNDRYPEDTIGRLMEPATAVFPREHTIADTIDAVRELAKTSFVTYGFVVDEAGRPIRSSGSPSSSAATCANPVRVPVPMSWVPVMTRGRMPVQRAAGARTRRQPQVLDMVFNLPVLL